MMVDADVLDGKGLASPLERAFENAAVDYVHLHFAKPGCFAAERHASLRRARARRPSGTIRPVERLGVGSALRNRRRDRPRSASAAS